MFYLFTQVDLLEALYVYAQNHEDLELDELIPLFITIAFSVSVFAIRRTLELKKMLSKTKLLSTKDPLTELYNRRYIQNAYSRELNRSLRKGKALSVLLIDVDDFKKVNDIYGHNIGDEVLEKISKIMLSIARESDITGRWGGEEFLIIFPETDLDAVVLIADRLIKTIDQHEFSKVNNVTISVGAVDTFKTESLELIIARADENLYKAKESGKNCYIAS